MEIPKPGVYKNKNCTWAAQVELKNLSTGQMTEWCNDRNKQNNFLQDFFYSLDFFKWKS